MIDENDSDADYADVVDDDGGCGYDDDFMMHASGGFRAGEGGVSTLAQLVRALFGNPSLYTNLKKCAPPFSLDDQLCVSFYFVVVVSLLLLVIIV